MINLSKMNPVKMSPFAAIECACRDYAIPRTLKAARADSRYLSVNPNGNKKLKNTADTAFVIWNIPAVATCPFRTAACEGSCYALKAEKQYPNVKTCRARNFEMTRRDDFVSNMIYTLLVEVNRNLKKGKKTIVRIHESGDFYNKVYMLKWFSIANYFSFLGDLVVFMVYTKSVCYLVGETIPANMVIRFSLWNDTKPAELATALDLGLPIYTADTEKNVSDIVAAGMGKKCECRDCSNCGMCWDTLIKRILCVIH